jgi:predicted ester cyclase
MSIQDTIAEGDQVVVRWTCKVTHTGPFLGMQPSGRKATVTGISILRFSEGKIVEGWNSWDQLGLLVQLGAVPPKEFVTVSEKLALKKA